MDLLESLNPPQREAVTHTQGPLLVLAGAGSGKTRVLTHRIAYLLSAGQVDGRQILAVTFTNKAAGVMKERVQGLIGAASHGMWIGTFHSICVRILRREAERLGYSPDFVIYDRDDQLSLMKSVCGDFLISDKQFPPRSLIARISNLKNQLITPEQAKTASFDFKAQQTAKVYEHYQKRLKENNAFDFDDLIMKTVVLFQEAPEVLEKYQDRFRYILVDEYQDTNHSQYTLINLLAKAHENICVVGDDDQSIYGWRGADITNILNFDRDFPKAMVVRLEQNYRSTTTILKAASEVIKNNKDRKGKTLWSSLEEGSKITLVETSDEKDEAATVVERVQAYRRQGEFGLRDMVVLYRTNAQSRALEEELRIAAVPYTIVGGTRFYERKEIKDILAYLKLLVNPRDTVGLKRVINVPRREIGGATLNALESFAFEKAMPLYQVFQHLALVQDIPQKKKQTLLAFWQLIETYTALSEKLPVVDLTSQLLKEIGYARELEADQDDPESAARLENIQELLVGMEAFAERAEEPTLKTFLSEVALLTDVDVWKDNTDVITLMTLHCAKGMEFPVVFIAGMEEGLFPLANAMEEPGELEEERRLFYVGLTRAKKKVLLLTARNRRRYEQIMPGILSRFVREIPADLVDREQGIMLTRYETSAAPIPRPERRPPVYDEHSQVVDEEEYGPQIQVGMRVKHPSFGIGHVVMKRGVGDSTQVTVDFRNAGQKKLMVKFAKLQVV
jgi:DNA helicase II / ATP-dependent DNA helicase PcrA